MRFVQSVQSVEATNCSRVRTQPSPEIRAHPSDPPSRCRGLFKASKKCDQSMFTRLLVARCLFPFLSLSRLGPFIVRSNGYIQLLHPSRCSQPVMTIVCTSDVGSFQQLCDPSYINVTESGIHPNPANLQCCSSTEAETGFVPTSAQFFAEGTFLMLRSPS